MSAYLIDDFRVPRPVYETLLDCTAPLFKERDTAVERHTRLLFFHLVASTLLTYKRQLQADGAVWVPVSVALLRKELRSASWRSLEDLGLIEPRPYSAKEKRSRTFRVDPELIRSVLAALPAAYAEWAKDDSINLLTGRVVRVPVKSVKHDENRNAEPALIREAMDLIRDCIFSLPAVEAHVERLRQEWLANAADVRAFGRYANDMMCLQALYEQHPRELGEGFWAYDPAYRVQMSGRISHIGGGLQTCSREMKHEAYQHVDNLRNYDLRASQVNGLIVQFELAGLDATWLKDYLADPEAKHRYAAAMGVDVDTWKKCLYAIFMGATLTEERGSVSTYLAEASAGEQDYLEKFTKFLSIVGPLKRELDAWHEWLIGHYAKAQGVKHKGRTLITNPAGKRFCLEEELERGRNRCKRRLAAFVLQGQEAAFVHMLTTLSPKYDYKVLANEHDGLVTLGEIPDVAVKQAALYSGLRTATLEEKPFKTLEEVADWAEDEEAA